MAVILSALSYPCFIFLDKAYTLIFTNFAALVIYMVYKKWGNKKKVVHHHLLFLGSFCLPLLCMVLLMFQRAVSRSCSFGDGITGKCTATKGFEYATQLIHILYVEGSSIRKRMPCFVMSVIIIPRIMSMSFDAKGITLLGNKRGM